MAPRLERQVGRIPPSRSPRYDPASRNNAQQNAALQRLREAQRPDAIFGQAAQTQYAYVHEQGNRNGIAQQSSSQQEQDDKQLEHLLGHKAFAAPLNQPGFEGSAPAKLPTHFVEVIDYYWRNGQLTQDVSNYYKTLNQGDSVNVPGQGGRRSLLRDVLLKDGQSDTHTGWEKVKNLGSGGFGAVELWQKARVSGPPIRTAVKDTVAHDFFRDYCAEAHFTRRLNDIGCINVINVAEWAFIGTSTFIDDDGRNHRLGPKHRICYEYAEHGDLFTLENWYRARGLVLPEAFLWHVFYSVTNALLYCAWGRGAKPMQVPEGERPGWDPIYHGDIKEGNILMTEVDEYQDSLYPCLKLCDFGMAWTIRRDLPAIQRAKSAGRTNALGLGGTQGYMAPETSQLQDESKRRYDELVGSTTDIYALGRTLQYMTDLIGEKIPYGGNAHMFRQQNLAKLQKLYSAELRNLLDVCLSSHPSDRPEVYNLWYTTEHHMSWTHHKAEEEQRAAIAKGHDKDCFHNSVLFSEASQQRYDNDPLFRKQYRTANLEPLWDQTGFEGGSQPLMPIPIQRQPSAVRRDTRSLLGKKRLNNGGANRRNAQVAPQGGFVTFEELTRREELRKEQERRYKERLSQKGRNRKEIRDPRWAGIKKTVTKMFGFGRR